MNSRDELKNAAYAELTEQGYLPTSKTDRMAVVDVVVDAVEGLIRADERERHTVNNPLLLSDLYAKVQALPTWSRLAQDDLVQRADVLALIDGGSGE